MPCHAPLLNRDLRPGNINTDIYIYPCGVTQVTIPWHTPLLRTGRSILGTNYTWNQCGIRFAATLNRRIVLIPIYIYTYIPGTMRGLHSLTHRSLIFVFACRPKLKYSAVLTFVFACTQGRLPRAALANHVPHPTGQKQQKQTTDCQCNIFTTTLVVTMVVRQRLRPMFNDTITNQIHTLEDNAHVGDLRGLCSLGTRRSRSSICTLRKSPPQHGD